MSDPSSNALDNVTKKSKVQHLVISKHIDDDSDN